MQCKLTLQVQSKHIKIILKKGKEKEKSSNPVGELEKKGGKASH